MKTTKIIVIALSALVLGSCATSSDVVDGGLFQKRKYNKGWSINKKSKIEISPVDANDLELAAVTFENAAPTKEKTNKSEVILKEKSTSNQGSPNNTIASAEEINNEDEVSLNETSNALHRTKKVRSSSFYEKRSTDRKDKSFTINFLDETSDSNSTTDATLILLVILALLLPPLAVGLYEGLTTRFWISVLLTLLFVLPGVIYALLIVLGVI